MNFKELRPGNYLHAYNHVYNTFGQEREKYLAIVTMVSESSISFSHEGPRLNHTTTEPIPLTEEWLIRLGFEKAEDEKFWHPKFKYPVKCDLNNQWEAWMDLGDRWLTLTQIDYVHEVQNLVYEIAGEELTIK